MVEDRNRADGMYFVRYQDPDARGGEEEHAVEARVLAQRRRQRRDRNSIACRSPELAAAGPTEVKVLNKDGAADSGDTAKRILNLLAEQLQ